MLAEVHPREVKAALFNKNPDKSPGPDGMSPGFYKKYWKVVGTYLVQRTQQLFTTDKFDQSITDTNIVLVPKKQDPSYMTKLRPISLCNFTYKVVLKVLANRFKSVLDAIISASQSTFIPGRFISDNIMISHEVMHNMKRKVVRKKGWMALKLDMIKSYDRVEWVFLKEMLNKMGFDAKLVYLFMKRVTSVRYNINHSGKAFGLIVPSRGIRQEDPLFSYMFLICMEGLTALINDYKRRRLLTGRKVASGAPVLAHMFFADDSYIYCKANEEMEIQIPHVASVWEGIRTTNK